METVSNTHKVSSSNTQHRIANHKRTDIPLLNLNPLMTKNDKRWFRSKFAEMQQVRFELERAALEGMVAVLGADWYSRYKLLLSSAKGTADKNQVLAIRRTLRGLCHNTAHTFLCHDTFFHLALQKQAVFEAMSGLRRKHPLVDVRFIMNDVYLEHGEAIDRVRNRKVMDSRYVRFICNVLSQSEKFKTTYNTYRGVYYGVSVGVST